MLVGYVKRLRQFALIAAVQTLGESEIVGLFVQLYFWKAKSSGFGTRQICAIRAIE